MKRKWLTERNVENKKLNKKEFKNFCLDKIDILVGKYRFFYSGVVVKTEKDLFEEVHYKTKRSRLTLYYHVPSKRLFLIIFCKYVIQMYYTDLSITTAKKYNKIFTARQQEIKNAKLYNELFEAS